MLNYKSNKSTTKPATQPIASQAGAASSATTPSVQSKPKSKSLKSATRAKAKTKDNTLVIYGVCGVAMVVFIAIIVWVVVSVINKPAISNETFVDNDAQSSISLTPSDGDKSANPGHVETHVVYQYDGDNVVGQKTYFEYTDAESARTAYEASKSLPEFEGAELSDKYIIVTADPSKFKGLTADDIRQQAEAIRKYQESQKTKEAPSDTPQEESHNEESPDHTEEAPAN